MALPIFIGYLPLGFAYGVLAINTGISPFWTIFMSFAVFAGAGQLIAVSMIGSGASILSILIASFMVNLRHFLMSAALAPFVQPLSKIWRVILSHSQTDEVFAVNIHAFRNGADCNISRLLACSLVAQSGWVLGSALGAFSGGFVADVKPLGLDFALASMFIALLVPLCIERISLLVALLSAFLAVTFNLMGFGQWSVICATLLGTSVGFGLSIKESPESSVFTR